MCRVNGDRIAKQIKKLLAERGIGSSVGFCAMMANCQTLCSNGPIERPLALITLGFEGSVNLF
jgi:hypothetical protein